MKTLRKAMIGLAASATFAVSGSAHAILENWYIDTDGPGGNAPVLVKQFVDLVGSALAINTFSSLTPAPGDSFTFNEFGAFNVPSTDGGVFPAGDGVNLSPALSATFVGTGSGTVGGLLSFLTGTLSVKNSLTTEIASFSLQSGSANLQAAGVLPNGTVSLIVKATSMTSGYFFDSDMNDLAGFVSSPGGLVLGFATTNALPIGDDLPARSGLVSGYNAAFNPDLSTAPAPTVNQLNVVQISNNGQFQFQVPEPASIALVGLGLIGLASARKRRSA